MAFQVTRVLNIERSFEMLLKTLSYNGTANQKKRRLTFLIFLCDCSQFCGCFRQKRKKVKSTSLIFCLVLLKMNQIFLSTASFYPKKFVIVKCLVNRHSAFSCLPPKYYGLITMVTLVTTIKY